MELRINRVRINRSRPVPTITRPTRICKTTVSLIDNIIISQRHLESYESCVLIDDTSDHLPCVVKITNYNAGRKNEAYIESRDTRKKSIEKLKESLSQVSRNDICASDSIDSTNDMFNTFHSELQQQVNKFCPIVKRKVNKCKLRKEPWVTGGMLRSIRHSKSLYKASIKKGATDQDRSKYCTYMLILKKTKRAAKRIYHINSCNEFKNNTKKLWQLINKVIGKENNKGNAIECIKIDNIRNHIPKQIANHFRKHYSMLGDRYAKKIPNPQKNIEIYLSKIRQNQSSLFLESTNHVEIEQLISKLPNKRSSGHDCINNILLKELKEIISAPLTDIFNSSLQSGVFPDLMKLGEVVPLHKSKSREDVGNYRPISLLLTISKLLEKIIYRCVYGFLTKSGQLYQSQYGFRKNHACDHAVGELVSEIVKHLQKNNYTVCILLDLSKAFDTLQHNVIFAKLERYGI